MTKVKDLSPNRLNPRRMTKEKLQALKDSIEAFGDLGGVVFNIRTKELVSAHQRSSVMDKDAKVTIEKKFDSPTPAGTVAVGFIEYKGERYSYREVDWDTKKQTEALLAANKHSGEWDKENLRILFADHPNISLELAGFTIPELQLMDIKVEPIIIQKPTISDIVGYKDESDDAKYLKNSPGPDEEADRERFPNNTVYEKKPEAPVPPIADVTDAYNKVEEKTTVDGKRIVLIIDCDTQEMKDELKKKLKPLVDEAGARFF